MKKRKLLNQSCARCWREFIVKLSTNVNYVEKRSFNMWPHFCIVFVFAGHDGYRCSGDGQWQRRCLKSLKTSHISRTSLLQIFFWFAWNFESSIAQEHLWIGNHLYFLNTWVMVCFWDFIYLRIQRRINYYICFQLTSFLLFYPFSPRPLSVYEVEHGRSEKARKE